MRTFDPTPLWRSTIGFDRLFNLLDDSTRWTLEDNYPPYNIERTGDDQYRIALALAGFTPDEVTITAEQNVLTVEGRKSEKDEHEYLYQGISARPFKRVFNLADHVEVKGASFEAGLLKIDLVREVPEAMKPRRIAINGHTQSPKLWPLATISTPPNARAREGKGINRLVVAVADEERSRTRLWWDEMQGQPGLDPENRARSQLKSFTYLGGSRARWCRGSGADFFIACTAVFARCAAGR
jgi:molecular chaperone IbpA